MYVIKTAVRKNFRSDDLITVRRIRSMPYSRTHSIFFNRKDMIVLPIGPLMIEHRVIERMINLIEIESQRIKKTGDPDCDFIFAAAEFMKEFTDEMHHGKEEEILFRKLSEKPLSDNHRQILDELLHEHELSRGYIAQMANSRMDFLKGEKAAVGQMTKAMDSLIKLYHEHIEKEDDNFFRPVLGYFTKKESDDLMKETSRFDCLLLCVNTST